MSITINQQPASDWISAYNPIDYVFSSTNVASTSFKFIVDVYVNGVNVHRELIPAHPIHQDGSINTNRIISTFVEFDFDTNLNQSMVVTEPNSIKEVQLKIGEQFEVGGTLTDYVDLAETSLKIVNNSSIRTYELEGFDYTAWWNDLNANTKFLRRNKNIQTLKQGQYAWLSALQAKNVTDLDNFVYKSYDITGALIATHTLVNNFSNTSNSNEQRIRIPSGWNVNTIYPNFIDSTVAYYTIQGTNLGDGQDTEIVRYNLDHCNKYGVYQIAYQNTLGGFDTFAFDLVARTNLTKKTKSYETAGVVRGVGSLSRPLNEHIIRDYQTDGKTQWRLTSDWIDASEHEALSDLFDSPVVYLITPDNKLVACSSLSRPEWEEKIDSIDRLFNLELTFEGAFTNTRQTW